MTIEFSPILTIISVCAAVYFAARSDGRASKDEASKKAQVDAVLSQKLDSISDDTKEIRKEITDVKVKVNDLSERVVIVEQSTKSAHHRIENMKNCVFKASVNTQKWLKAAGIRAVKTAAQTAVGTIGAAAVIGAVDWKMVVSASALAALLSVLTSVAGIPEVSENE